MRGFLLWTRVAWWALLVGVVELLHWLGGSRHGRATAAATLLAALGGGAALFHPALVTTTRAPINVYSNGPAPSTRSLPTPSCPRPLAPILIDTVRPYWGNVHVQFWSEPSVTPDLPLARCPLRALPIPLAHAELRTSDLVYRSVEGAATYRPVQAGVAVSWSGQR